MAAETPPNNLTPVQTRFYKDLKTDTIWADMGELIGWVKITTGGVVDVDAIMKAINGKADLKPVVLSSNALTFVSSATLGSPAAPATGALTASITAASVVGVVIQVIHNSTTDPLTDVKFKKLSGSGSYVPGAVNYIYMEYVGSDIITYSVNQILA